MESVFGIVISGRLDNSNCFAAKHAFLLTRNIFVEIIFLGKIFVFLRVGISGLWGWGVREKGSFANDLFEAVSVVGRVFMLVVGCTLK